jgi:hypothetical protein
VRLGTGVLHSIDGGEGAGYCGEGLEERGVMADYGVCGVRGTGCGELLLTQDVGGFNPGGPGGGEGVAVALFGFEEGGSGGEGSEVRGFC